MGLPPTSDARPRSRATAAIVAVGLVAWAAAVDPWGFQPFTTLRWPVLAAVVLVAAIVGWPERPALPPLLRGLGLAFLAWMALATAFAVDPITAWLGHPQRHLGLLAWVVLVLAFRVGTVLGTDDARRVLGRGAAVAAVVVGAGAALEAVGVGVASELTVAFGSRASGWFGQPAYLAAAGVLLAPVALGAAARETGPWRWAGWIGGASAAAVVVASQTRGGWIGLLVAAIVAWPAVRPRTRAAWAATALAGVALLLLAVVTPLGGRATAGFDLDDGTSRGRLDEWRVAVAVVAEHPVVGTGPEGYRVVVPAHLDDDYTRRYGRDVVVDRAHDGVLDVAAAGGLPAAALYVTLVVIVLGRAWRVRRTAGTVVVGAAAAVAGFAAQQVFLFPVAEVDPVAWLLAGVVVAATTGAPDAGAPGRRRAAATTARTATTTVLTMVTMAAIGGVALGVVGAGGLAVAADHDLAEAVRQQGRGDHLAALAAADRATARRPDDIDTWYVAAGVAGAGDSLLDVDAALDRIEAGLERSPRDPALLDRREQLLAERALRSGLAADQERAAAASTDRIAEDPANPAHHRRLGIVLQARGDIAGARSALERALALDPDDGLARAALDRIGADGS